MDRSDAENLTCKTPAASGIEMDLSFIDPSQFVSLPGRIALNAAQHPSRMALRCDQTSVTWGALAERAGRVASALRDMGCSPEDSVAILASNGCAFVESFLGIVSGGMCAVTLPTMQTTDVVSAMMRDSGAKVLIASSDVQEIADHVAGQTQHLLPQAKIALDFEAPGWTLYHEWLATKSAAPQSQAHSPDSAFNIVYSSGTTGVPKGIVHSHRTRATMAAGFSKLGFDNTAITLISTPLYTNISLPALFAALWGGGCAAIMGKFEPAEFLRRAEAERATHFFLVPTQIQRILETSAFDGADLSATQLVYVAGSNFRPELKQQTMTRWPGALLEVYGMTEGAPMSSFVVSENPSKIASVGQPAKGSDIKIIDDAGALLPAGDIGEIVGRSGSMMLGYYNRPDLTEDIIWRDSTGRAFFRSGDIGRFDADGFLYILDRKKDMIISGGHNIYAVDLENLIAEHPDISEAAVFAAPSARWGETPVAAIVLRDGASQLAQEILDWCNNRLGKLQRLAGIEILDALPRNALGKVLKKDLRERFGKKYDDALLTSISPAPKSGGR